MRIFSPAQRYIILVNYGAVVIVNDALLPLPSYHWGTESGTRRFAMCRRLDVAVRCACGCDVWAPIREIQFDHIKEWISGGLTVIGNGAPLRATPCHAGKTAASAALNGKIVRTRRKLATRQVTHGPTSDPQAVLDQAAHGSSPVLQDNQRVDVATASSATVRRARRRGRHVLCPTLTSANSLTGPWRDDEQRKH